ncbi:hypothetical protein GGR52DRAFT_508782 [Hypoxylon sp. FL1284]|nr:hypothetical protein GGR52DRAFT_508782 [Hypoxylon sp. FL1284]
MEWNDSDFPEFDNQEEYYDDDAIYEAEAKAKDLTSNNARLDITLYKQGRDDGDGAARTTRKGGERGQVIYSKEKADYDLRAERLVWIDGWRQTTGNGNSKKQVDEMTLVVLKLVFATKTPNTKVAFAAAEMRFKSEDKNGNDPEVVAWGPFRRPETWNASKAQRRVNMKAEGNAGTEQLSGVVGLENETSWDRIDFDSGSSTDLFSARKDTSAPNGVMWKVKQNRLHKQGVTPELRVAVLVKRLSPGPYLVDFRLEAYTGTAREIQSRTMNLVGLSGGDSLFWRVEPRAGEKDNCYAEGVDIAESIDADNLGKLPDSKDGTNLNPTWLNTWDRFEVPQTKDEPEASKGLGPFGLSPGLLIQTQEHGRLVALEARFAQAEARMATQDQLILKLQQTVAAMEQTLTKLRAD